MTLYISSGPRTVDVPYVVGRTEDEALEKLENAGFQVDLQEEYSSSISEGKVISQSLIAGTSIEVGSAITIVVSRGEEEVEEDEANDEDISYESTRPSSQTSQETSTTTTTTSRVELVVVPDLKNYTKSDAESKLKSLGFTTIIIERESSSTVEKDYVIKVSLGPGSSMPASREITLTVSDGESSIEPHTGN